MYGKLELTLIGVFVFGLKKCTNQAGNIMFSAYLLDRLIQVLAIDEELDGTQAALMRHSGGTRAALMRQIPSFRDFSLN